ncbi:MAG: response regulator [Myxococcales bacterium FL481]|nr:MAG: response regulator [Myxococcales bacterium FL481]
MAQILLVEDNHHNRELFKATLRHYGHEVLVACDGEMGLAMVHEQRPDLVVLDLSLPKIDGWTVARRIREDNDARVAALPILALTAHAMRGDRERALEAGCDDYLAKPVSPRELGRRVGKLMADASAA